MKYFRTSLSSDNLVNQSFGGHSSGATMMRMSDSFHEGCTVAAGISNNQLMTSSGGGRKMRQMLSPEEQVRGIPVRRMTSSKTMTTLHEESYSHTTATGLNNHNNDCVDATNNHEDATDPVINEKCDNNHQDSKVNCFLTSLAKF